MTKRLKGVIAIGVAAIVLTLLVTLDGAAAGDTIRTTAPAVPLPVAAPSRIAENGNGEIFRVADTEAPKTVTAPAPVDPAVRLGAGKSIPALT